MGLYLRNNRYYYKKNIEGKSYYKALRLRRGQEVLLSSRVRQVEDEIVASHFGLDYEKRKTIGLHDFIEFYLERKRFKKSIARDEQRLELIGNLWGNADLASINSTHIEKLEKYLFSKDLSPTTVNRYFELVRHLFNLAIEQGYLKDNPAKLYEPFQEEGYRRALGKEEVSRILDVGRKLQEKAKAGIYAVAYDIMLLGLATGMRLSEILNLKNSYIREDLIYLPFSETKSRRRSTTPHQQRYRIIVLNDLARSVIERQGPKSDYVFSLKKRDANAVFHLIRRIRKDSCVPDFTFHQLRHTAATIISEKAYLATAKTVLGHADIKTTLQYTHPGIDEQRRTYAKLGTYIKRDILKRTDNK